MFIYPTITTTPRSDWRAKVKEAADLGLTDVCVFPTALEREDRRELYRLLEKVPGLRVPFVHLRGEDMDEAEIDYLVKRFNVKVLNAHASLFSVLK